jgi:hypothetical protein
MDAQCGPRVRSPEHSTLSSAHSAVGIEALQVPFLDEAVVDFVEEA